MAKYVNLTPEHLFAPIAVETMGVLGPRTKAFLRDLDNREGGCYHLPHPEAVSSSAGGQLCLSDGHHRSGCKVQRSGHKVQRSGPASALVGTRCSNNMQLQPPPPPSMQI